MGRFVLPVLAWAVFALSAEAAQQKPRQENEQQVQQRKLANIFRAVHGFEIKGRRWIVLDMGPVDFKQEAEGWLIEATGEALKLLDKGGNVTTFKRPRPGEKRPDLKKDSVTLEELRDEKFTIVWRTREKSYA